MPVAYKKNMHELHEDQQTSPLSLSLPPSLPPSLTDYGGEVSTIFFA